jgi:hypothetical protein
MLLGMCFDMHACAHFLIIEWLMKFVFSRLYLAEFCKYINIHDYGNIYCRPCAVFTSIQKSGAFILAISLFHAACLIEYSPLLFVKIPIIFAI